MEDTKTVDPGSAGTACYAAFRHLLGERVQTHDGVGVLVGVKTPCNGLYYRPEIAELMVWYPPNCGNHLSSWTYKADEVKAFESSAACDDCGGQTTLRTIEGVEERKCLDCGAVLSVPGCLFCSKVGCNNECLDAAMASEDGCCPKCGWNHENGNRTDSMPVLKNVVADYELGYCGGQHWDEVWKCDECGSVFEFSSGSV